jgi:hypothetical protein
MSVTLTLTLTLTLTKRDGRLQNESLLLFENQHGRCGRTVGEAWGKGMQWSACLHCITKRMDNRNHNNHGRYNYKNCYDSSWTYQDQYEL